MKSNIAERFSYYAIMALIGLGVAGVLFLVFGFLSVFFIILAVAIVPLVLIGIFFGIGEADIKINTEKGKRHYTFGKKQKKQKDKQLPN